MLSLISYYLSEKIFINISSFNEINKFKLIHNFIFKILNANAIILINKINEFNLSKLYYLKSFVRNEKILRCTINPLYSKGLIIISVLMSTIKII